MNKTGSYSKYTLHHYRLGYICINSYSCAQASPNPIKLYCDKEKAFKAVSREGVFFFGKDTYYFSDLEVRKIYFNWSYTAVNE